MITLEIFASIMAHRRRPAPWAFGEAEQDVNRVVPAHRAVTLGPHMEARNRLLGWAG